MAHRYGPPLRSARFAAAAGQRQATPAGQCGLFAGFAACPGLSKCHREGLHPEHLIAASRKPGTGTCRPGRRPVRVPFCGRLIAECDRSPVLREAVLPRRFRCSGPCCKHCAALRSGSACPRITSGVLQPPAEIAGWDGPGTCGHRRFPSSLRIITGFVSIYLEFPGFCQQHPPVLSLPVVTITKCEPEPHRWPMGEALPDGAGSVRLELIFRLPAAGPALSLRRCHNPRRGTTLGLLPARNRRVVPSLGLPPAADPASIRKSHTHGPSLWFSATG